MYHKVPVISTNVGGIPEIIEHDINGLLSNKHDDLTLCRHIIELIKSPEKQHDFVEKSYYKLTESFTTARMAEQTLEIYKQII